MAYRSSTKSSRYSKTSSKGKGRGKGKGGKGKKEYDPKTGFVVLSEFEPEERERGKRYPDLTGYVNFKPEALKYFLKQAVSEEYGTIENIRIALWEKEDGNGYSGTIQYYAPEGEEDDNDDEVEEEEDEDIPF